MEKLQLLCWSNGRKCPNCEIFDELEKIRKNYNNNWTQNYYRLILCKGYIREQKLKQILKENES